MEDPNIIACLFAAADEVDGKGLSQFAVEAINLNNNERRFEPLVKREPKPAPERPSRESTAPPDDNRHDRIRSYFLKPGLQLTFNPGPRFRGSKRLICLGNQHQCRREN